jgi:nucleoside-diphosphate-sugar epimerase
LNNSHLRCNKNILVTGCSGYIGQALCKYLVERFYYVRALTRQKNLKINNVDIVKADINSFEDITPVFSGIDCVIHLAGRVHILNEVSSDPLTSFRSANVDTTIHLARQALKNNVRRFIFISSIGVNGSKTVQDHYFCENSPPSPQLPYAISKLEAEVALKDLFINTSTELVIIRPPLVYGSCAPGNFGRLIKLIALGIPLPFKSVNNQRSMIALVNLLDFIFLCINHPNASNELFLISDAHDVSLNTIVELVAEGIGNKPILFRVPRTPTQMMFRFINKSNLYTQLFDSLRIDCSKAMSLLNWKPVVSPDRELIKVGQSVRAK